MIGDFGRWDVPRIYVSSIAGTLYRGSTASNRTVLDEGWHDPFPGESLFGVGEMDARIDDSGGGLRRYNGCQL